MPKLITNAINAKMVIDGKKRKTLNVIQITFEELRDKWGDSVYISFEPNEEIFIRCNHKSEINWDKAQAFNSKEIEYHRKIRKVIIKKIKSRIRELTLNTL